VNELTSDCAAPAADYREVSNALARESSADILSLAHSAADAYTKCHGSPSQGPSLLFMLCPASVREITNA